MATGPIETHLHRSFNWENGAPGPREGQRGRSARCGNGLFAQCVRLRSEINHAVIYDRLKEKEQTMLDAIDRGCLEGGYLDDEDLRIVFERLLGEDAKSLEY